MATPPRGYEQSCPLATSLDVVGSRWALLVVRELILGPRRFSEIEAGLETASTDMVTSRLRQLETAQVLERTTDRRYRLTDHGYGLVPAIEALSRWAAPFTSFSQPTQDDSVDLVRRVTTLLAIRARTRDVQADAPSIRLTCEHLAVIAYADGNRYLLFDESDDPDAARATATVDTVDLTGHGLVEVAFGSATVDALVKTAAVNGTPAGVKFLETVRFQPLATVTVANSSP